MKKFLIALFLSGCAHVVVRDPNTFAVETLAALARQQEAAKALLHAAADAKALGLLDSCAEFAAPALLIEATAYSQAHRALFLAGLKDTDPGPPQPLRPVSDICGVQP